MCTSGLAVAILDLRRPVTSGRLKSSYIVFPVSEIMILASGTVLLSCLGAEILVFFQVSTILNLRLQVPHNSLRDDIIDLETIRKAVGVLNLTSLQPATIHILIFHRLSFRLT